MTEYLVNCKGYVLYRLGIDRVEIYRSIPRVSHLHEWFKFSSGIDDAHAVAVVHGIKSAPNYERSNQVVAHMLAVEGQNWFSNRDDNDLAVRFGTTTDLLCEEYLNENNTYYLLYLALQN